MSAPIRRLIVIFALAVIACAAPLILVSAAWESAR